MDDVSEDEISAAKRLTEREYWIANPETWKADKLAALEQKFKALSDMVPDGDREIAYLAMKQLVEDSEALIKANELDAWRLFVNVMRIDDPAFRRMALGVADNGEPHGADAHRIVAAGKTEPPKPDLPKGESSELG